MDSDYLLSIIIYIAIFFYFTNTLPISDSSVQSIAVIGPFADTAFCGGYSFWWQPDVTTLFEGIKARAGNTIDVI